MLFLNYLNFLKYTYKNLRNKNKNNKNIILVEVYFNIFPLMGVLFLIKALTNIYQSKIIFYYPKISHSYFDVFKTFAKLCINIKSILIFLLLGARLNLCFVNNKIKSNAKNKFKDVIANVNSKEELLCLKLEGIEVGDLFYDNYLRQNAKHTIEIDSELKKALFLYISDFYYWYDFFEEHDVKSVVVSHAVYNLAIPLRIAQSRMISSYIASINFIEHFDSNRKTILQSEYRDSFKILSDEDKSKALLNAKKILEDKFEGAHNLSEQRGYGSNPQIRKNLSITQLETFGKKESNNKEIFEKNGKPNVVIMAHCFYDAPHADGKFLFADFYEWVNYLGKLSNETDYNWYIKKHPHSVEKKLNDKIIEKIVLKYPKVQLLKENVTNNEILNDDVSLILTVHGSAGYEFSYHEVPVILGSSLTSYENYNICYQPENIEAFDFSIKNFRDIQFPYDKKEILKYYYNIYIAYWNLIPIHEYNKIMKLANTGNNFKVTILNQENEFYKYFNNNLVKENFVKKIIEIEKFIKKKEYRLFSK